VKRTEASCLRIIAIRMEHLTREKAEGFYHVHVERPFFPSLVAFMTSDGVNACGLCGGTGDGIAHDG
jgi:nucleoside-diphosphate kinase